MNRIGVAILLAIITVACSDATPKFQLGEMVELVVNGQKAQIVDRDCVWRDTCRYWVRIGALMTNTHLLSPDGAITQSLSTEMVREFEIRPLK